MEIITEIEKYVREAIEEYKEQAPDHYDFWEEHIKYVYEEASSLATKYNADEEIVKLGALLHEKCVFNHRSSKNATSIEEMCVADADILAHFDNIPMLKNSAKRNNIPEDKVNDYLKEVFEKDYNDLSDMTKESFKERYESICDEVLENKKNNLTFN